MNWINGILDIENELFCYRIIVFSNLILDPPNSSNTFIEILNISYNKTDKFFFSKEFQNIYTLVIRHIP